MQQIWVLFQVEESDNSKAEAIVERIIDRGDKDPIEHISAAIVQFVSETPIVFQSVREI